MSDEETLAFAGAVVRSIWTLELLLLMKRHKDCVWKAHELVQELRASRNVVQIGLASLAGAGLVAVEPGDGFRLQPATPRLEALVESLQTLYASRPMAVINAIAAPGDEKLRIFADSFRLKE